jgi:UDP-galactopyranose mutase
MVERRTALNVKAQVVVVGAGFAGATMARLFAEAGLTVQVIERRDHVGGNAHDRYDEQGVLIHPYGPHIFHTNSDAVWAFLSRFTAWRSYEHRVLAKVGEQLLPIPINRTTINELYGYTFDTDEEVVSFYERVRVPKSVIENSEDLVLASVGEDLCSKFFAGYTRKQWGLELRDLAAGVAARIPTRTNTDDRYFTDRYQAMPEAGYHALFGRMLDHEGIAIALQTDYFECRALFQPRLTIYCGPIDRYFDHCFGALPYRSLRFEHQQFAALERFQPVGTVNFPNDYDYTRITEFKYLTGQSHPGTSIVYEFPSATGEPFYPIPRPENEALFKRYQALADKLDDVVFVGRLAQYKYYNMDQVIAAAIQKAKHLLDSRNLHT